MKRFAAFVFGFCAAATSICSEAALIFNTFVTSGDLAAVLSNNATIGFAYAGNKFVGSVYFGTNNSQLYQTDLLGQNVAKFGTPIPGFSGEIYVSSSLGIAGFGPRDIFAGSEAVGTVVRIANDGTSQGIFTSGLIGGVRSIAFDPFGLYNNQMIVSTNAGRVYTVSNTGVATLLANVGEDAEGLNFTPKAFGSFAAGTLFVASESSGSVRAISPGGVVTTAVTGLPGAEMLSFVPLDLGLSGNPLEGFYAAAYPNNIQKSDASQFVPFLGDMIVTSETGHQVWDTHFNSVTNTFEVTQIGTFPAQPEDGIFVTTAIINPCTVTNTCATTVPEPNTLALLGLVLGGLVTLRLSKSRTNQSRTWPRELSRVSVR